MELPSENEQSATEPDDESGGALDFSRVEESARKTKQTFIDKIPSRHAFYLGFGSCFSLMTAVYITVAFLL